MRTANSVNCTVDKQQHGHTTYNAEVGAMVVGSVAEASRQLQVANRGLVLQELDGLQERWTPFHRLRVVGVIHTYNHTQPHNHASV